MNNRKLKMVVVMLTVSLTAVGLFSGCDKLKKEPVTEKQTESVSEKQAETQPEKRIEVQPETVAETETETELQTDIAYISQDKSIEITLPDSTWAVSQDADEMRVFRSSADAMINIVHAKDASSMRQVTVFKSKEELQDNLVKQYSDPTTFEILDFENFHGFDLDVYKYTIQNPQTGMWAYQVTYAILDKDEEYIISGTVQEYNKVLLDAVQKAVFSFKVNNNPKFKLIPGTPEAIAAMQTETEDPKDAAGELKTLNAYQSEVVLRAVDDVNVRKEPGTDAEIIDSLVKGDAVRAIGETVNWFKVSLNGSEGFVKKEFLSHSEADNPEQTEPRNNDEANAEVNGSISYDEALTMYASDTINVRSTPGTDSDIVGAFAPGDQITVIGETDNWYIVSINGVTAYVAKQYVSGTNTEHTDSNQSTQTTTNIGTVSGTVLSVSGQIFTMRSDDGNEYDVYVANGDIGSIAEGAYVTADINYDQVTETGALYATSVS